MSKAIGTFFPSGVYVHPHFVLLPTRTLEVTRKVEMTPHGAVVRQDVVLRVLYDVTCVHMTGLKVAQRPAFGVDDAMSSTTPLQATTFWQQATKTRENLENLSGRVERLTSAAVQFNSLSIEVPGATPEMNAARLENRAEAEKALNTKLAGLTEELDFQLDKKFASETIVLDNEANIQARLASLGVTIDQGFQLKVEQMIASFTASSGMALAAAA